MGDAGHDARRGFPWVRLLLVGLLVALDLWSKAAVFGWLEESPGELVLDPHGHPRFPIAGGWLTFMLSRNTGAAWGVMQDYPWILVGGRVIAVLVLSWMLVKSDKGSLTLALVLVLAGALGNLYDNLFLDPFPGHPFGAVRDFIDVYFGIWDYHFPTFNVADSCITCGAVILLGSGLFGSREEEQEDGTVAEGAGGSA